MAYIYKKAIGKKSYYYLRASAKKGSKTVTKDIAYLGNDVNEVRKKLAELPSKYAGEIRKAYKTINRFIEANHFLEQAEALKLKADPYIEKSVLENIEACRLHWHKVFQKADPTTKKEIFKNFIIEFAFNTASIEGNTITLKEAQKLLVENLTPKDRTLREIYDLQNTEKVFFELLDADKKISHEFICSVHDALLEKIDERKGYRTSDVRVLQARFKSTPAPYVLPDMNILLKWFDSNQDKLHPFVLALVFHHKFEKIHPFFDGNGRTGRMLMNYILLSKGYPPLIIRRKRRQEYVAELSKADESVLTKADAKHYKGLVEFAAKELVDSYWSIFL